MAVLVHSAQRPWCKSSCFLTSPAMFIINQTLPNRVANLHSTCLFCCGVWHMVNSKWSPRPLHFALAWNATFLLELLHQIFFTTIFSLSQRSFINEIIVFAIWSLDFRNKLKLRLVTSSTARSQNCNLPKLLFLTLLMSMKSLSLGVLLCILVFYLCFSGETLPRHNSHMQQTYLWSASYDIWSFLVWSTQMCVWVFLCKSLMSLLTSCTSGSKVAIVVWLNSRMILQI